MADRDERRIMRDQAVQSLFDLLSGQFDGAIAVDAEARIIALDDKYRAHLGVGGEALGRPVEEAIPNSMMRKVVETGQPILLDLMRFGPRSFVVIRLPLKDTRGRVIGGVGFVLFERAEQLKPLMAKFQRLEDDLSRAQRELAGARRAKYTFSQLIGASEAMREVKRLGRRAAQMESTVLLLGETGTGKELLAHAIHAASSRAERPMVSVNVAAVPETLLEAEFFGAAPGAYTGVDRKGRDGKFKLAHGGTLFLDEIGDMPLSVQAKLLRVLQEREIEPLGSNKVIRVDVRIIAATSHDLAAMARDGRFRADLFYRLNVVPITLPPLRQRVEDVESIAESLLESLVLKGATDQRELDPTAVAALEAYDWPGNVRELSNVLERVVAMTEAPVITADHLRAILHIPDPVPAQPPVPPARRAGLGMARAEAERAAIADAIRQTGGNKVQAARLLGISRATLYERLKALD